MPIAAVQPLLPLPALLPRLSHLKPSTAVSHQPSNRHLFHPAPKNTYYLTWPTNQTLELHLPLPLPLALQVPLHPHPKSMAALLARRTKNLTTGEIASLAETRLTCLKMLALPLSPKRHQPLVLLVHPSPPKKTRQRKSSSRLPSLPPARVVFDRQNRIDLHAILGLFS